MVWYAYQGSGVFEISDIGLVVEAVRIDSISEVQGIFELAERLLNTRGIPSKESPRGVCEQLSVFSKDRLILLTRE